MMFAHVRHLRCSCVWSRKWCIQVTKDTIAQASRLLSIRLPTCDSPGALPTTTDESVEPCRSQEGKETFGKQDAYGITPPRLVLSAMLYSMHVCVRGTERRLTTHKHKWWQKALASRKDIVTKSEPKKPSGGRETNQQMRSQSALDAVPTPKRRKAVSSPLT